MTDHQKHSLLCAIGALLIWPLNWVNAHWGVPWGAFIAGTALAWGYKFLHKSRHEGDFSQQDALTDTAGACIGALTLFIVWNC